MLEERAIRAGLLYCVVLLAAGLVLSVIRTFWIAPLSGQLVAVWLEAPVILAVSWTACGWVAEQLDLSESFLDRLTMGGVALAGVIGVEAFVAIVGDRQTLRDYVLTNGRIGVLLGLLAQLGFAGFPILRSQRNKEPL
jgi:hypothetical protein